MATVRSGNSSVLLVIDVQVGVMRNAWDAQRIVGNVSHTIERARAQQVPVLWIQQTDQPGDEEDDDLVQDSPGWQLVPELIPAAGEPLIRKRFQSSFEQTDLEQELAKRGATHIVLVGAATNWCIRATAYGALERGYDLTLIRDAHTTEQIDLDDGTRIDAAQIVRELNIAISGLSYPGRRTAAVAAAEADFAPAASR